MNYPSHWSKFVTQILTFLSIRTTRVVVQGFTDVVQSKVGFTKEVNCLNKEYCYNGPSVIIIGTESLLLWLFVSPIYYTSFSVTITVSGQVRVRLSVWVSDVRTGDSIWYVRDWSERRVDECTTDDRGPLSLTKYKPLCKDFLS